MIAETASAASLAAAGPRCGSPLENHLHQFRLELGGGFLCRILQHGGKPHPLSGDRVGGLAEGLHAAIRGQIGQDQINLLHDALADGARHIRLAGARAELDDVRFERFQSAPFQQILLAFQPSFQAGGRIDQADRCAGLDILDPGSGAAQICCQTVAQI